MTQDGEHLFVNTAGVVATRNKPYNKITIQNRYITNKVVENVYVYQGCFWHCIWYDKCRLSRQAFDFDRGYFREKLVSHHRAMNEGCSWYCIWHDKCRLTFLVTSLWLLFRLSFGRGLSPTIMQWMKLIPVYIWDLPARKPWHEKRNRTLT